MAQKSKHVIDRKMRSHIATQALQIVSLPCAKLAKVRKDLSICSGTLYSPFVLCFKESTKLLYVQVIYSGIRYKHVPVCSNYHQYLRGS